MWESFDRAAKYNDKPEVYGPLAVGLDRVGKWLGAITQTSALVNKGNDMHEAVWQGPQVSGKGSEWVG